MSHLTNYSAPTITTKKKRQSKITLEEVQYALIKSKIDLNFNENTLSASQKKQLLCHLYQPGLFNRHGFLSQISKLLMLTRETVYKYIKSFYKG